MKTAGAADWRAFWSVPPRDLVARPGPEKLSQAFASNSSSEGEGLIGGQAAANSPPDGYTFLVAAATSIIMVLLGRFPMIIRVSKPWGGSATSYVASWFTPQRVRRHSRR